MTEHHQQEQLFNNKQSSSTESKTATNDNNTDNTTHSSGVNTPQLPHPPHFTSHPHLYHPYPLPPTNLNVFNQKTTPNVKRSSTSQKQNNNTHNDNQKTPQNQKTPNIIQHHHHQFPPHFSPATNPWAFYAATGYLPPPPPGYPQFQYFPHQLVAPSSTTSGGKVTTTPKTSSTKKGKTKQTTAINSDSTNTNVTVPATTPSSTATTGDINTPSMSKPRQPKEQKQSKNVSATPTKFQNGSKKSSVNSSTTSKKIGNNSSMASTSSSQYHPPGMNPFTPHSMALQYPYHFSAPPSADHNDKINNNNNDTSVTSVPTSINSGLLTVKLSTDHSSSSLALPDTPFSIKTNIAPHSSSTLVTTTPSQNLSSLSSSNSVEHNKIVSMSTVLPTPRQPKIPRQSLGGYLNQILPLPFNAYKTDEEIKHCNLIKERFKQSLQKDQNELVNMDFSKFKNVQDAVERLLAFHIYQVPPKPIKKESTSSKTEVEEDSIEDRIKNLYQTFDILLLEESKKSATFSQSQFIEKLIQEE